MEFWLMKPFTSFFTEAKELSSTQSKEFETHKKFAESIPHGEDVIHAKSKTAKTFNSTVYIPNKHVKATILHYKKQGYEHSVENHSIYGKTHVLTKGEHKAKMFDNTDGSHELTHTSPMSKSESTEKDKSAAKKAKITKLLKPKALRPWD